MKLKKIILFYKIHKELLQLDKIFKERDNPIGFKNLQLNLKKLIQSV